MAETTFHADNLVQVTNSRLIIGGKMYPMSTIASVQIARLQPRGRLAGSLLLLGLIALIVGIVEIQSSGTACFGLGIILLAGFIADLVYEVRNPRLTVAVESAAGELRAVVSRNRPYIQKVASAINAAIIARG